jgi:transcriptional regulator with XRE-family HTH domain
MKNLNFKIARLRNGLRQIDIANKTGLSTSLLSLYENNLKTPSKEHATKINEVLKENIFAVGNENAQ